MRSAFYFLFAFRAVFGLKCFSCNSTATCAVFNTGDKRFIETCSEASQSCMTTDRQVDGTLDGAFVVENRGCWSTVLTSCETPLPGEARICTCDFGDLCNCGPVGGREMAEDDGQCPEERGPDNSRLSRSTSPPMTAAPNLLINLLLAGLKFLFQ